MQRPINAKGIAIKNPNGVSLPRYSPAKANKKDDKRKATPSKILP